MNYPAAEQRGILKQRQLLTLMQYSVFLFNSLVSDVLCYTCFVSKLANCIDKISISPKLSAPKFGFHFRMLFEYFFSRDTLQHRYNTCGTILGNRLNQKMNMILVCSNFQKTNIVSLFNFQTNLLKRLINSFAEYNSSVLRWTHKMVQQNRYIVRLVNIFAFGHSYKDMVFAPQSGGELTPKVIKAYN